MRLSGYVARVGKRRRVYRALMGKPGKSGYLEDPGVDGRIILRWILLHGVSKYISLPFIDKRMNFHHS
jgi:hypothetical protein